MANQPNIVFMLGDNVGWGDLSCYGGLVPTPLLDQLASEGTRFTNFNTKAQCISHRQFLPHACGGEVGTVPTSVVVATGRDGIL